MSSRGSKVLALLVAFVVGGAVGAALVAWLTGDVGTSQPRPFVLPDATGPGALRGASADDATKALEERGFTCEDATPQDDEDPRTFRRCALERADDGAVFRVTLAGSPDDLVAITTTLVSQGTPLNRVVSTWAEVATSFVYDGADPARARRWLLASYETGGRVALGDAYLHAGREEGELSLEVRARGDQRLATADTTIRGLAKRFQPVLVLNASKADPEPYDPISIRAFVSASRLTTFRVLSRFRDRSTTAPGPVAAAKLRARPPSCPTGFRACYVALDVGDWAGEGNIGPRDAAGYARLHARLDPAPTVYWHAVRDERGGVTLQYWFLYLFNDFGANRHESDWEHVGVYLDANHVPLAVFYSSHEAGSAKHWVSLSDGLNRDGDNLMVYVARGSHANYFGSGAHVATACRAGFCGHGLDVVGTELRELHPQSYALVGLTGRPFSVGYGTGNYIIRGRLLVDVRPFPDPRARAEFEKPRLEFERASEAE